MLNQGNTRQLVAVQVPVIRYDEERASDAYLAHIALIHCEIIDPSLPENPAWQAVREFALRQFTDAYCVEGAA